MFALLGLMGGAYAYRIHVEEVTLVEALGEPYQTYQQQTRRLVPFLF
jgi:protein-S-isoprenylcysteine O-methyltransferase Ste14